MYTQSLIRCLFHLLLLRTFSVTATVVHSPYPTSYPLHPIPPYSMGIGNYYHLPLHPFYIITDVRTTTACTSEFIIRHHFTCPIAYLVRTHCSILTFFDLPTDISFLKVLWIIFFIRQGGSLSMLQCRKRDGPLGYLTSTVHYDGRRLRLLLGTCGRKRSC